MISNIQITLEKLREFRHNQTLSREQFELSKLIKFRKFVAHVNRHSPYYAEIIRQRGIQPDTCIPEDFPLLDKSILMDNFDRIVTDRNLSKQGITEFLSQSSGPHELLMNQYRVIHTSGSSGQVGYFVYSKADWQRSHAQHLRLHPSNPRARRKGLGRLRIGFFGAVGGHYAGVNIVGAMNKGLGKCFFKVGLFEVNRPLLEICAELNTFQPDLLTGYTAALLMLAAKQREGVLNIAPARITAGGEAMSEQEKMFLQQTFACEASNSYACSEHLLMGMSARDGASMVLLDDDIIFEPHADHVLTTNLFNFTLPLIRYRMSDMVRPIPSRNGSAPYLEIERLVGRAEMAPVFINQDGVEDFISPITIVEIFVKGVERFQLHLLDKTRFSFLVCLDSSMNAEQKAASVACTEQSLRAILRQKMMVNVQFEVQVVSALPINPITRKFQLIVDDREKQNLM